MDFIIAIGRAFSTKALCFYSKKVIMKDDFYMHHCVVFFNKYTLLRDGIDNKGLKYYKRAIPEVKNFKCLLKVQMYFSRKNLRK
jgi:hypothetical protein